LLNERSDRTTAAALLGLKPRSVRKFIERGMIKGEKRGRDWFITQEEVDRYNRERRKPGPQKGHKQTTKPRRS
jgi:excisionase family DNA binding protein